MKYLTIILLFILIFNSCKKHEEPSPTFIGTPEFYATFNINGVQNEIIAGLEDVYLYSSFHLEYDSLIYFTGNFSKNKNSKFKIGFRDYKIRSIGESLDMENIISLGSGNFKDSLVTNTIFYRVNFNASSSIGSNLTYNWNFGDGSYATSTDTFYSKLYSNLGTYYTSLEINNGIGCTNNLAKNITTENQNNCSIGYFPFISFDTLNGANATFFLTDSTGINPKKYLWDFGNGSIDSIHSSNPSTYYNNVGIYTVCVTQTDDNNCIVNDCQNIAFSPTQPTCMANFEYKYLGIINSMNKTLFNTIYIDWYNENGVLYSTRFGNQDNQKINISSLIDFKPNEKGEKTKKIELEFSCLLYNEFGESIILTDGKASIAVAYY